ncbi:MAG: F0F1 ATP synthase subunit delta [Candidatus Malihini olakiniferum]
MSKLFTVARPYAKAAFDFALEHRDVERWQGMLEFAAEVIRNEQVSALLYSAMTENALASTFINVCGDQLDKTAQNLIKVMIENGRLVLLPEVLEQFKQLRAVQELTVNIEIFSAKKLSEPQLNKISSAMEKRLSRKVKLNCKIDKSVVAGAVIRAGDMVIDGSIRGRLEHLKNVLLS